MNSVNPFIIQITGILLCIRSGINNKGEKWKSEEKPEDTFDEVLVTGKVYRHILVNVYGMLVEDKSVLALELLGPDEKQKVKDNTKKILKGRLLEPEILMELYKSVYTLSIISQQ